MNYSPIAGVPDDVLRVAPIAVAIAATEGLDYQAAFNRAFAVLRAGAEAWAAWESEARRRDPASFVNLNAACIALDVKVPTLRGYVQATIAGPDYEEFWGRALGGERVFTPDLIDNLRSEKEARRRLVLTHAVEARQAQTAKRGAKENLGGSGANFRGSDEPKSDSETANGGVRAIPRAACAIRSKSQKNP